MSRLTCQVIQLDDHPKSKKYILKNESTKFEVTLLSFGATILSILQPDKHGYVEEVTLNYSTVDEIKQNPGPYYGCTVGRFANRINNGKFKIDGHEYNLPVNNGSNSLHGGIEGFDKKYWDSEIISTTVADNIGIKFSYLSIDDEEGYPGDLSVSVSFLLSSAVDMISIVYIAEVVGDSKPTIINLTNHTYFNLSGNFKQDIKQNHRLRLYCNHYLPSDDALLPTGQICAVNDTLFDFTSSAISCEGNDGESCSMRELISHGTLGKHLGGVIDHIDGGGKAGLDHCFVVNKNAVDLGNSIPLSPVAVLTDEVSGRRLVVHTTKPGIQVYTANWLPPRVSDASNHPHTQHMAVCLETQNFPDAVNHPHFPSPLLRPGDVYQHKTTFSFDVIAH